MGRGRGERRRSSASLDRGLLDAPGHVQGDSGAQDDAADDVAGGDVLFRFFFSWLLVFSFDLLFRLRPYSQKNQRHSNLAMASTDAGVPSEAACIVSDAGGASRIGSSSSSPRRGETRIKTNCN